MSHHEQQGFIEWKLVENPKGEKEIERGTVWMTLAEIYLMIDHEERFLHRHDGEKFYVVPRHPHLQTEDGTGFLRCVLHCNFLKV